jgi:hypothetical protein
MMNRDFKEFVASFNAHAVKYLVVGGMKLPAVWVAVLEALGEGSE